VLIVTHDVEEAVFLGQRVVVLGSHPGRVVSVVEVPLGDERDLTLKRAPEFLALRASIEDTVRVHHRRASGLR
jgi:NitT/TauT family transport system ATP-binding protein